MPNRGYLERQAFPRALEQSFQSLTSGMEPDEVPLFETLRDAFEETTWDFLVEVLHGNRSQVTFATREPWEKPPGSAQCELCDLLIVSFRAEPFAARLTLLQNKADRSIGGVPDRFVGDVAQWTLLTKRPTVTGVGRFRPPPNLLSGALLPSVGSFGVFYRNAVHQYSMAYRIASELRPLRTSQSKNRKRTLGSLLGPVAVRSIAGHQEIVGTPSIFHFAMHLGMLRIGTPIHGDPTADTPDDMDSRKSVRAWLRGVLVRRLAARRNEYVVAPGHSAARTLLDRLGGGTDPTSDDDDADGPTIVVVQSDGRAVRGIEDRKSVV